MLWRLTWCLCGKLSTRALMGNAFVSSTGSRSVWFLGRPWGASDAMKFFTGVMLLQCAVASALRTHWSWERGPDLTSRVSPETSSCTGRQGYPCHQARKDFPSCGLFPAHLVANYVATVASHDMFGVMSETTQCIAGANVSKAYR